jgi:Cu(I)/Ag(I) efflux system membrane fusion protein
MKAIIILFTSFTLFMACSGDHATDSHKHDYTATVDKYTCPMHPQVISEKAGTCPVCGMDLVKKDTTKVGNNELMLSDIQMRLANITSKKVTKESVGQSLIVNGRLEVDEQNSEVISSRAAGRVEKLHIRETGRAIKKGQPLYTLYSEPLLVLQREYLLAKEQYDAFPEPRYKSFLNASEKKLILYGLTKTQINQLTNKNALEPRVTFLSPASGIVTEINSTEGQYISEGGVLYKIEDISELWVEAELYPNETGLIQTGDQISIKVNGSEEVPLQAQVSFLSPEYRANTQVVIMRASINNQNLKYKPGQQVQVYVTHSAKETIAIPVDAVIRSGSGSHVYLQTGKGTFRPQRVETGMETFDLVEITNGVHEGDTIAVTGAYLLYSEMVLKKGIDPTAGQL